MSGGVGTAPQGPRADDSPSIGLSCTPETFAPVDYSGVRWLDMDADYPLMREVWEVRGNRPPAREEFRAWRDGGYQYCAIVEDGKILSIAASWSRSPSAWELAAVWTREEARGRGYAKAVCSFATAHILANGRIATCGTRRNNLPMIRVAESIGFRRR